eukprot:c24429_g2_i1 orf=212-1477(+)
MTGLISVLWSTDVLVALLVLLAAPLLYNLWLAFVSACWNPQRIKRAFQSQGITCLPYRCFHGNLPEIVALNNEARRLPMPDISHDIAPRILPHFHKWSKIYGDRYVHWVGPEARFNLPNVEDVKEILSTNFGFYPKPDLRPDATDLFGNGLLSLEGETWAQHRHIMNRAFFLDKLKAMIPTKVACTKAAIDKWDSLIEEGQAIDVHKEFKDLTADIIAHTVFGSSFTEGKQVFELQAQQQILMDKFLNSAYIPGARFLPTAFNRLCWRVDRKMNRLLRHVINRRLECIAAGHGDSYGNDLLGLMLAANKGEMEVHQKQLTMDIDGIIDECKTFYFAGHETTASFLTWTVLLLAINPGWQERTREEVQAICGMEVKPTADSLSHLKIMGMVLNEALRLYPPAAMMLRKASRDMQLGKIRIPK